MSRENVELVRNALAKSFGDEHTEPWDPRVEWVVAREHPGARTIVGREAVADYLADWQATLAGLRFEVDRVLDAEDAVVAVGTVHGTGSASAVEVDVQLALVCFVQEGSITRVEEHLNPAEALKALGLQE